MIGAGTEQLEKLSKSMRTINYTREYDPSVNINDVVTLNIPELDIFGRFRVKTQTISMDKGAKVDETVTFEQREWRR